MSRRGTDRGGTFRRGESGYEQARSDALWNARLPDRYPAVIVQANDVYDVVAAVRLAKREGLRIGVRSGGHSWVGNHIRDGGMLLDVSRLNDVTVDKRRMRATTGPGRAGHELAAMLARQRLFFPSGHCPGVAVGGYLLQGGYGWHSRALGPACMSVEAVDVVTADGELVRACADENSELYWSARGAGPGFFGVVTRYHLIVYPRPRVIGVAAQTFSIDMLEDVFRWAHAVGPEVPASIELQFLVSRHTLGVRGAGILAFAPVFADSWSQAWRDLSFFNRSPLRRRSRISIPFFPSGLSLMYRQARKHYPDDHRYAVDNMWTRASIDELMPGLRRIAETLPPAPSHVLWMNWAPPAERPDMAYSMEDDIYLALYSVWKDTRDDADFVSWPVERMREMDHLASGCQLADENLAQRPLPFATPENMARLDRARSNFDPDERFYPWMNRV